MTDIYLDAIEARQQTVLGVSVAVASGPPWLAILDSAAAVPALVAEVRSLWEALAAVEDRERALHVALRDMCAEPSFGVGERRRILAALDGAG